ncbi:DNA mismatch repair protein Msh6-like isoform X2 [Tubulanus polymorphus]|uniref:DNA mismatch repair protein Msh6-like isoform X2 n=1 Tax=Tubulanus polymorphus TaxID=672921 RepID=UPI003DA58D61
MSQQTSLFSFFSPKGKQPDPNQVLKPSKTNDIPRTPSENGPKNQSSKKQQQNPKSSEKKKSVKQPKLTELKHLPACEFEPGDLVWAKLEGYPWWPSLVCNHPTKDKHFKRSGGSKELHVQFFDDPPSRAWVKLRRVCPFVGLDDKDTKVGGRFFSGNPVQQDGTRQAAKATEMSRDERLEKLVVTLQPSDDEDEEEEMDVDDEGESEDEADTSKENDDTKVNTPSKDSGRRRSSRTKPPKKRRRILVADDNADDSDGDEFKPDSDEDDDEDLSSGVDENEVSEIESENSEPETPVKEKRKRETKPTSKSSAKKGRQILKINDNGDNDDSGDGEDNGEDESLEMKRKTAVTPVPKSFSPLVTKYTKSKLASFAAAENVGKSSEPTEGVVYTHLTYEFLKPDKIKDKHGRPLNHPDYDPRTLNVPENVMKTLTPAMRQWWEIKKDHFDTILFFKVGKFYELYHMDAVTAVNELGIIYMKGNHAHCGFPEIGYARYAETLVQKGYKVARIEQTETPAMMEERCKKIGKPTKFDRVVKREVCRVTSKGTKTFSFIDGDPADGNNNFLLAIAEKVHDDSAGGGSSYGICFLDTSIGKFHIGQFDDDRHCSRLRTLVSHYPPVEVLYEKGKISDKTQQFINTNLSHTLRQPLTSWKEFWDAPRTLKQLAENEYFVSSQKDGATAVWPAELKMMVSDCDSLNRTAVEGYELALSSLGAVTWYLSQSFLDDEILSMKNFQQYTPIDLSSRDDNADKTMTPQLKFSGARQLVLDSVTLANLEIFQNSGNGSAEGTLLQRLDECSTPFGKRLFKQWLCSPLCDPASVNDRLDAVDDLIDCQDVVAEVKLMMQKLPDLERLLSKIHSMGSANRSESHPDGRAIFFEDVTYSKRKIEDFISTLSGFKVVLAIVKKFGSAKNQFKSRLLRQCLTTVADDNQEEKVRFPDVQESLDFFDKSFDHEKARKEGVIIPAKGVDTDYDEAMVGIKTINRDLEEYLSKQKKRFGCPTISYWGTGKNRFQMEIPDAVAKKVPHEFELTSQRKGFKRYQTTEVKDMYERMVVAEERKSVALRDIMRRIFYNFDSSYGDWESAVQCMSILDVLINMAAYSRCGDGTMVRPEIVLTDQQTRPFIEIREGRHPCISRTYSGDDFIPNDTVVGLKDENQADEECNTDGSVVLVTGPNMGGKSTLMRQVGLIVVLAQMGCYVPAEKCRLSPVDRVFTRLGASDRIMAGESTFFVELSETSAILKHATKHSLVLLDELGRGTATYDGTAIACAVVEELSQRVCCRTLFSTHYHSLVEEFSHDPNIRLGHMSCMVENEDDEDPGQETITFLYKFVKGACPKSYGFNAARLANIPDEVIEVARTKAKEFEESLDRLKIFRMLNVTDVPRSKLTCLQKQIHSLKTTDPVS